MIRKLSESELLELINKTPEQAVYDWKKAFTPLTTDEAKAEIIKDITAIANATKDVPGFLIYGVNPLDAANPIVGVSNAGFDDAPLQQLLISYVDPPIKFTYYELESSGRTVAIIQVEPSEQKPSIIMKDIGHLRKGQVLIRRGSSTDGIKMSDLMEFFRLYQKAAVTIRDVQAFGRTETLLVYEKIRESIQARINSALEERKALEQEVYALPPYEQWRFDGAMKNNLQSRIALDGEYRRLEVLENNSVLSFRFGIKNDGTGTINGYEAHLKFETSASIFRDVIMAKDIEVVIDQSYPSENDTRVYPHQTKHLSLIQWYALFIPGASVNGNLNWVLYLDNLQPCTGNIDLAQVFKIL